ncbi:hypothetical protein C8J57DRAFT_1230036 [Mycena rebaudengoi]|nr:hypothetical protein C8J57DRAFT_1230036 [Mycena rebaudengoi]
MSVGWIRCRITSVIGSSTELANFLMKRSRRHTAPYSADRAGRCRARYRPVEGAHWRTRAEGRDGKAEAGQVVLWARGALGMAVFSAATQRRRGAGRRRMRGWSTQRVGGTSGGLPELGAGKFRSAAKSAGAQGDTGDSAQESLGHRELFRSSAPGSSGAHQNASVFGLLGDVGWVELGVCGVVRKLQASRNRFSGFFKGNGGKLSAGKWRKATGSHFGMFRYGGTEVGDSDRRSRTRPVFSWKLVCRWIVARIVEPICGNSVFGRLW